MTFSIVGRCERTGMLGVAITTSSICVGSRCPWARARVGAVASQNITNPALGNAILELLMRDFSAKQAIANVVENTRFVEYRQILVIDSAGMTAHYSGEKTLGVHAVSEGGNCVAGGNILDNDGVPGAMTAKFAALGDAHLAERLVRSLEAGLEAGGESGDVRSSALLVVHDRSWPLVDLRVDWDEADPVASLVALWKAYEPQIDDYTKRAINPSQAPSYGVPGDP